MMLYNKQDTSVANRDLQRQPEVINGTLVFDEKTEDLQFVSIHDKEIRQVIFRTPQNLRYLDISRCKVESIVFTEGCCPKIKSLYLQKNNLQKIEFNVPLPGLQLLDLSYNENLQEIKVSGINKILPNLKYFYVHECNLQDLSDFADFFIKDDVDFNIEKNPLVKPPEAIVKQGQQAIKNYFREIGQEGVDYIYEAKLLILGDPRAGKTTLVRKIFDFDAALPEEDETTRGVELSDWKVYHNFEGKGNREVIVHIWDFGGQAIYKNTHRFFLTQRSFYVILSDAGASEKTDFKYWLYSARVFGADSPVYIFINKKEDRNYDPPFDLLKRINPNLKGNVAINLKKVSKENNKEFLKILDKFKAEIVTLPHIGEPVPANWKKVRDEIYQLQKQGVKVITYKEFTKICERFGISKHETQKSLAEYFHDLGVFSYFGKNEVLKKYVFLDNQWLINGAYKVVDSPEVEEKQGRLTKADFDSLFSGEYTDYRLEFKELLKEFNLIYEKNNFIIVPQKLPQNPPHYQWDNANNVSFIFEYNEYMPAGILWQFIVEMNMHIKDDIVWRYGVVLEKEDGTQAEVIEEYGKDTIKIRVRGISKEDFRASIIDRLEEINKIYHNLPVKKFVPCVCKQCRESEEPHLYPYETLLKYQSHNKKKITCDKSLEEVSIDLLLKGIEENKTGKLENKDRDEQKKKTKKSFTSYLWIIGFIIIFVGSLVTYFSASGELIKKISGAVAFVSPILAVLMTLKKMFE